ncbi:unnamed protein product [Orchesella dallaii]|uniref:C2H2-type domain-containing protein n=1 Tax=Orchesella dallaii TaxID=48710 RepID=A0ABP1PZL5_9HEXA
MLYKESSTPVSKSKIYSSQRLLDAKNLVSLKTMAEPTKPKLSRPIAYDTRMGDEERATNLPQMTLTRPTAAVSLVDRSRQTDGPFQSSSKNTFRVKRNPSNVLQQYFSHTFDPAELRRGYKNESYAFLELECKICNFSAPIQLMYTHALDIHMVNLCIYCLATFREGRQLQVHLTRSHQVQHSQFLSLEQFQKICGCHSTLFCIDCDRQVELTGNTEQDEELVTKHVCRSDDVQCVKCAKKFLLKEISCHIELCGGKTSQPSNVLSRLPVFKVKEESQEMEVDDDEKVAVDTDIVSESEVVPKTGIEEEEEIELPERKVEVKSQLIPETNRLRNRDYRCRYCHMVVPPSKHAEHGLQCTAQSQVPSQQTSDVRRSSLKLKLFGNHNRDSTFLKSRKSSLTSSLTVMTSVNGGESPCDSNDVEDKDVRLGSKIVISRKPNSTVTSTLKKIQDSSTLATTAPASSSILPSGADIKIQSIEVDGNTTPQQYTPPYSPHKVESDDAPTDIVQDVGRSDDSMSFSHAEIEEKAPPKYRDPLLNEDDPSKRRTLLINELCDYLELKHKEEYRINDNLDVRTRDVDIFHPIGSVTGDEILETMVSNACAGCTYCRQAKIVGVDRRQLVIHLLTRHTWNLKFHQDVEKPIITPDNEESVCVPEPSVKMTENRTSSELSVDWRSFRLILLEKVFMLTNNIFNFPSREPFGECPCECLLCGCPVNTQKLLFPHWYKTHPQTSMKCYMCHEKFLFVGALFSHICYGTPHPVIKEDKLEGNGTSLSNGGSGEPNIPNQDDVDTTITLRYQCGLCDNFQMPGFFNYIVHLRTDHNTCELCLQPLADQKELQTHILKKHRLNYYCWKCRIAYSDLETFDNHMFWKHNNAGVDCKRCLNKKWLFVYHFCRPPTHFACKDCKEKFTRPMSLTVHKRTHSETNLRKCPKHSCQEKFISKKLLEKHLDQIHNKSGKVPREEMEAEKDESQDVSQDGVQQEDSSVPEPVPVADDEDMHVPEDMHKEEEEIGDDDAFVAEAENVVEPVVDAVDHSSNNAIEQVDQVDQGANETSENILNKEDPEENSMQKEENCQFPENSSYPDAVQQSPEEPLITADPAEVEQLLSQQPLHSEMDTSQGVASSQPSTEGHEGIENMESDILGGDGSPKRFDISEYLGPNLSEDESESEADAEKSMNKEAENVERVPEVVPEEDDDNDPIEFAFNLGSPDMSNYEDIMRENEEMELDTSGVYSPSDTNSQTGDRQQVLSNSPNIQPDSASNDLRADLSLSDTDDSADEDTGAQNVAVNVAVNPPVDEIITEPEEKRDETRTENDMVDAGNIDCVIPPIEEPSPKAPSAMEPSPIAPSAMEPSPIEPSLIEPSPIDPSPIDPSPIEPSPVEPPSIEPSPIEPPPIEPSPKAPEEQEGQIISEASNPSGVQPIAESFSSELGNFGEYNLNLEEPSAPIFEDELLPEHIMREHALFSLEHEHDYSKKVIYNPSGTGPLVQYSGSEIGDNARFEHSVADTNDENGVGEQNNYQSQEGNSSTASTFNVSHSTSGGVRITMNHSMKRSRSSSSSSSSSDSSSSGSSSESSSKSSESEGESDNYEASPEVDPRNQSSLSSKYQQFHRLHSQYQNPYSEHARASTSSSMSHAPVKRGRGRPKGSLNRDKNGLPTAKKFQVGAEGTRKVGRPPASRNTGDDCGKPKRKYRKTKGKVGRPKSISAVESINLEKASLTSANAFPESDLETEESDGEEVYHRRQVTEPIYDKMHSSDRIWSISNEEYLLRLLRGVDDVEKLRKEADEQNKAAAISNGHDLLDKQVETSKKPITYSPQKPVHVVMKGRNFSVRGRNAITTKYPSKDYATINLHPARPQSEGAAKSKSTPGNAGRGGRGRRKNATASRSIGSDADPANNRRKGSSNRTPKAPAVAVVAKAKKATEDEDNKPYCHCRQPYSDRPMIGCDFPNCPIEWYHMECVGISKPPEGQWTCPNTVCMKRRIQSGWSGHEGLVGYSQ